MRTKFVWTIAMLGFVLMLMPNAALSGGKKPDPVCAAVVAISCGKANDVKPCKAREAKAKAALAQEAARQADAGRAGKTPSADDKAKVSQLKKDLDSIQAECASISAANEACKTEKTNACPRMP